ncbi:MAG: NUDIX domain-containing protein [Candidatus Pacebacteria bacterium]|nr:NUDIX domain-containing protein [Candidatus Paceibacterota bacterium]
MDKNDTANKPEELLDWVDDNDQIIGQIVRKKANSNPKYIHREVGVLIFDQDNRVLLQKRSQYKNVFPGMWSITAGHILSGEQPLATAHTELKEELGFDTDLTFLKKELHRYDHESHFMYYYLGRYNGEKLVLEKAEVEKTSFFSKDELEKLIESNKLVNKLHLPIIIEIFN